MNQDKLKEILEKIPVGLLAICFMGYLGWDYYSFTSGGDSALLQKQVELDNVKKENLALNAKLTAANEFFKHLEQKREEIRALAQQLEDLKATVSSEVDVPGFMKTILVEAKRVGITVYSIKPTQVTKSDYYEEHPFDLGFRGVYVQLVVFLEHLASLQNLARVDNVEIHPIGNSFSKYVELEGSVQVKTYKYLGSKADTVLKVASNTTSAPANPAAPGAPGGAGTKPASSPSKGGP